MNTKELLEKIARYKSAMEAETDVDTKKKFQSRIDQLEKDIAQVEAAVEKKEEKIEKQEDKALEEAEKKLRRYKDAMDAETDPDTKAKFQKRIDDLEKQLKGVKEQIKEEKKEIEEQKKDIKDAVQDVQSAQKAVRTQAIKKAGKQVAARKTTATQKKTRKKTIANIISKLDKLIDKNPALKAKYKGARGGSYMQYPSVDLKRDAGRASKPFGYRFKGDNTKVPRPDQRGQSNVYYENRANRADVYPKRKIKLEDGGEMMADGGTTKGKHYVGRFTEAQLKNKEDKKAIEKAQKETGLKYVDTKMVKKAGKIVAMDVYLIDEETYLKQPLMADGGMAGHGKRMSTGGVVLNIYESGADWKINKPTQREFDDYKSAKRMGEKSGAFEYEILDEITGDVMYSTHSEKMTPSLAYKKGGKAEIGEFTIKYWETEEDREEGMSEIFAESYTDISKAKSAAKDLFHRQGFAAVEVEDEKGESKFHISDDEPSGESYAKGGKAGKQGYDDREDESLAMRRGKTASKDLKGKKKKKEKSRRDDAGFEKRAKVVYTWKPEAKQVIESMAKQPKKRGISKSILNKKPSEYYAKKFPELVNVEKQ